MLFLACRESARERFVIINSTYVISVDQFGSGAQCLVRNHAGPGFGAYVGAYVGVFVLFRNIPIIIWQV